MELYQKEDLRRNNDITAELKLEEAKYRKLYESKSQKSYILDELKADVFKMAISRLESKGVQDTYIFLKSQRDKFSQSTDKLGLNLANAYGLVVGKLWKHYQKSLSNG